MAQRYEDLARGSPHAVFVHCAVFEFNGYILNTGLINNLAEGCCVEAPVMSSTRGLDPLHGALPVSTFEAEAPW